jgi:hypothetical protein
MPDANNPTIDTIAYRTDVPTILCLHIKVSGIAINIAAAVIASATIIASPTNVMCFIVIFMGGFICSWIY